jgi:uracil-DNA glycosylase family 4
VIATKAPEPRRDCPHCPRLADFRRAQRKVRPEWHNAPVPAFGALDARLLIVGLAPGLKGANRTARPFTGDHAGRMLYATLLRLGLARGTYDARADDGLSLQGTRVTNAVRCVPPQNKPLPAEFAKCRPFLVKEIAAMPRLGAILALGAGAHDQVLAALELGPKRQWPFAHGAIHEIEDMRGGALVLIDSYHCSRQNTNTGRLTQAMFESAVATAKARAGL